MGGPLVPIEPLFPTGSLSPESLPCSVLMDGLLSPIEPLFPVEHLSPEILPWSVLMDGRLSPIKPLYSNGPFVAYRTFISF